LRATSDHVEGVPASSDSTVTRNTANVTGGTIVDDLPPWDSGMIHLYGSSFSVGGQILNYGTACGIMEYMTQTAT